MKKSESPTVEATIVERETILPKAIQSCESLRSYAEKVKVEEQFKHRPGHPKTTKTWRYKLALGMMQVYDQIEHKRRLRANWDAEMERRKKDDSTTDRGSGGSHSQELPGKQGWT